MKMESAVPSPLGGKVCRIYVSERQLVTPGAPLFALEPAE
jgi:urea carboxylase